MNTNLSTRSGPVIKSKKQGFKIDIGKILIYVGLFILAVACFLPFYIMIINATHSNGSIARGISILPGSKAWENYMTMSKRVDIWRGFLNSILVSGIGTALLAYFGTATSYALSKFKFPGNKLIFWIILCTMMIPPQLSIIGFYNIIIKLDWMNKLRALIIPMIANAQFVFFVKQYLDANLPKSILESARIDGASEIGIYNKIVLPLSSPAIATMGMFAFIFQWNQLLIPQIVLRKETVKTVPILVANARGIYKSDVAAAYMAIALSVVPVMIVFVMFSKRIIGGVTAGAVKG